MRFLTRKIIMLSYGPIVLAASTGTEHLDGLYADDSRGGHIAHGKTDSFAGSSDVDRKSRFHP